MKQLNYSIRPYWDARAMDEKTKLSRIMLTVNLHGSRQFRITLKLRSTKPEFDKAISATSKNLSDEAKSVRKDLNDYLLKAETILSRLDNPSKEIFTRLFKSETDLSINNKTSIEPFFKYKVSRLFSEERFATSINCKSSCISLLKYRTGLNFEDIDESFLKGYVAWMTQQGKSISTAQIYLRNLRAVFNEVIKEGIISEKRYPFKNFKMGATVKSKAVLYPAQIKQLLEYPTKGVEQTRAVAWWFFCYCCNGMNFYDVAMLKYKNISGDILTFVRHKTKNTTTSGVKEIKVYLHDFTGDNKEVW